MGFLSVAAVMTQRPGVSFLVSEFNDMPPHDRSFTVCLKMLSC